MHGTYDKWGTTLTSPRLISERKVVSVCVLCVRGCVDGRVGV